MENNLVDEKEESPANEENSVSPQSGFLSSLLAYTLLSWLLATFPALMIIPNVYRGGSGSDETNAGQVQIILIGFCSIYGIGMGLAMGMLMTLARSKTRRLSPVLAPFFGLVWGLVIGAIGGFPIFFIGGIIVGWMVAVPLGIIGFTLFAIIYESLAARRRVLWWHIVLIAVSVTGAALGGIYFALDI